MPHAQGRRRAEKIEGPAWRKYRGSSRASNGQNNKTAPSSHRIASHPQPSTPPVQPPLIAASIAQPAIAQSQTASFSREQVAALPPPPSPNSQPLPPLCLHGARTSPSGVLKLRGAINGHPATLLLDSGASSEFISLAFAKTCGLDLQPSGRTIQLADGSITAAAGQIDISYSLAAKHGSHAQFASRFTATQLPEGDSGFDAILGYTWLTQFNPQIDWRERSVTVKDLSGALRTIRPVERIGAEVERMEQVATISLNGLRKSMRRGDIDELYVVMVKQQDAAADLTVSAASAMDPAAQQLLKEFADVFPDDLPPGLPPSRGVEHAIELKPGSRAPICRPLRHQSPKDLAVIEEYTRKGLESGQIRVSNSPFGAAVLIVRKKDGTPRVVIDYRALNELTVKNKYPLPLMDEMFDRVHGAKYFSTIDLRTGFHQIRVAGADVEKTAFRTRYGSFEYLVLPMGLCNAPATFMQLMNDTFRDLLDKTVLVFLDDILIFSKTREEHIQHVREVLTRLRAQKLYGKLSKCSLFQREVQFLGHRIGQDGLAVSQDKVTAVRDWPAPKDVKDVRSFLGLANFYRRFVQNYARLALPLTELTKESVTFAWGPEQERAFAALKDALSSTPVLLIPDPAKPYTLNCDACDYAIGATLQQDHGNGLQPVAYRSRKLTDAERNYDTREKEFYALVDACSHWRHYLHGELPFSLLSDHDSLKYHKTMPNLTGRLARWVEKMAEFDYTIQHIPGVKNVVADALSRRADLKGESATDHRPMVAELVPAANRPSGASAHSMTARPSGASARSMTDRPTAAALVPAADEALHAARLRPRPAARARAAPSADSPQDAADRARFKTAAEALLPAAPDRPAPNKKGTIVMPSQRCTATTKTGAHCRQRTARGQFCWNHLASIRGLRIKKSAVPGAGLGLFAARPLPKDYTVDYTGDRIPLAADNGGTYFLQTTQREAIDAARTNCGEGRWVNDPRGTAARANAVFVVYTPPGSQRTACVRTLRPVPKGEEILVKYGADYWRFALRGKPLARKQGRRRKHKQPQPLQLAPLTATQIQTSMTDDIRAASHRDPEYVKRAADPPAGVDSVGGVLWRADKLIVPNDHALRTRLLAECHDAVTGGHFGRDKTLEAVRSRFEWDGMSKAVDEYVATCDSCQRNKPSQQLTPGALMPLPLPDAPCREWTTDEVSGLPRTKRGHDAIQVYVERLCKLKHFAASRKSAGAKQLAEQFVHTVVRAHGVPDAIISDRDPRFTASYYRELMLLLGTTLRMSTARHPQSDGQSEREIRTLITQLRAFCNEHQDDWDDYLDMFELAANSTRQESTQHSPFELLHGVQPRLPIDLALAPLVPKCDAAVDRAERMARALRSARERLLAAQERQVKNARRRDTPQLAVGDKVLLTTEGINLRGGNNKLCSKYIGPFAVTAVVNANAYTLKLPPQLAALHPTFNIDKLKLYRDGRARFPDRPQRYERPPPEAEADSNGDQTFVVEEVLASRRRGRGPIEYLVAWRGYPPEENTWEPRNSLADGAADALALFERRQEASED